MMLLYISYSFSVYVHHFRHYYPIDSQTSLKRKSLFFSSLKPLIFNINSSKFNITDIWSKSEGTMQHHDNSQLSSSPSAGSVSTMLISLIMTFFQ
jgi:hypothetical protein